MTEKVQQAVNLARQVMERFRRPMSLRWIEVRVWADYFTADNIHTAPDTFDIRDALRELEKEGVVEVSSFYEFQLAASNET